MKQSDATKGHEDSQNLWQRAARHPTSAEKQHRWREHISSKPSAYVSVPPTPKIKGIVREKRIIITLGNAEPKLHQQPNLKTHQTRVLRVFSEEERHCDKG